MKIILFAFRDVGFDCLNYLIKINKPPMGLVIPKEKKTSNFKSILKLAKKNNIRFFLYNKNKKNRDLINYIKSIDPDYGFTCYFPFILDTEILQLFSYKILNLHGGILPNYKGALSSMWAIINNEKYSGSTIHFINQKIDQGNIIEISKCKINKYETNYNLYLRISRLSVNLFKKYFNKILNGEEINSKKQNKIGKYYSRQLPNDGFIDWKKKSIDIARFCRAFDFPGFEPAISKYKGKKILIRKVRITKQNSKLMPGQITKTTNKGIWVSTKDYDIFIDNLILKLSRLKIKDIKLESKLY